jgi:8-oxo-dGTP pyrophosphatase MutT (NUDIX family)
MDSPKVLVGTYMQEATKWLPDSGEELKQKLDVIKQLSEEYGSTFRAKQMAEISCGYKLSYVSRVFEVLKVVVDTYGIFPTLIYMERSDYRLKAIRYERRNFPQVSYEQITQYHADKLRVGPYIKGRQGAGYIVVRYGPVEQQDMSKLTPHITPKPLREMRHARVCEPQVFMVWNDKFSQWQLPAGWVEIGEEVLHAARRHFLTETGMHPGDSGTVIEHGKFHFVLTTSPSDELNRLKAFQEVTVSGEKTNDISHASWIPLDLLIDGGVHVRNISALTLAEIFTKYMIPGQYADCLRCRL